MAPPPHPAQGQFRAIVRRGVLLVVLGCALLALGAATGFGLAGLGVAAGFGIALGVYYVVRGIEGARVMAGQRAILEATRRMTEGKLLAADRLLLELAPSIKSPTVRRALLVTRARLALRLGELGRAGELLDAALGVEATSFERVLTGSPEEQIACAHGLRAFVSASRGDDEAARRDARAARDNEAAGASALAEAALAEAILLDRAGDRVALGRHLEARRLVLLGGGDRRERAIVRAYQRMLHSTATTPYRHAPRRDSRGDEPALVDWVAAVAPGAAAHVREAAPAQGADVDVGPVTAQAQSAVAKARRAASARPRAAARGGALALVTFAVLVLARVVSLPEVPPHATLTQETVHYLMLLEFLVGVALPAIVVLLALRNLFRGQRAIHTSDRLSRAFTAIAVGDLERAERLLAAPLRDEVALLAAQAELGRSYVAERRADLGIALAACDRGLALLASPGDRRLAADVLYPELVAQRAFVLTALGREGEANAELAGMPAGFVFAERARARVRMLGLARRGDFTGAARVAEGIGIDVPLGPFAELLADAVRVVGAPARMGAVEIERVRAELGSWKEGRAWLDAVVPGLAAAARSAAGDVDERGVVDDTESRAEPKADAARRTTGATTAERVNGDDGDEAELEVLAEEEATRAAAAASARDAGRA